MNNLTDVVKNLIIINVIVFFAVGTIPSSIVPEFRLFSPLSSNFEPYQLITHMFMHAGIRHLLFNMIGLYFLGPMVENYIGSKKFFILYFLSGFLALGFHLGISYFEISNLTGAARYYAINRPMLGASGAVYGVMAAFATLFPNVKLMLLIPPIPVKAKYLVLALVAFDLYSGLTGNRPGIANFAHVGGAIMGFLVIIFWRKTGFR